MAWRDAPVAKQAQSAEIGLSGKQRQGAIETLNAILQDTAQEVLLGSPEPPQIVLLLVETK